MCNAFEKSIFSNCKNEIFNLGYGGARSVKELVNLIGGKKFFYQTTTEPFITHAKINKIKAKLKWKLKITLEKGIEEVLRNIEYWKNAILWDKKV